MPYANHTPAAARIDGRAEAARLREQVARQVDALTSMHGIVPGLAVILIGDDPASHTYVRSKRKLCAAAGMDSFEHNLPTATTQQQLLALIATLNADPAVHGILVQLPLPAHISDQAVLSAIAPAKDVDGFHVSNVGALWSGGDALVPCTPLGCMLLLRATGMQLDGQHAVIVGRSNIVGKPLANLLLRANCTVTLAHSHTHDLPAVCRTGDILVAAVGRPGLIGADCIKPGATIIDVGINRIGTTASGKARLRGDVDFEAAATVAAAITPVPGGVGPMTIACLLHNTVTATCRQNAIRRDELLVATTT